MRSFIASIFALTLLVGPAAANAKVKVGVSDWPGWVAWYVAEEQGFFKKHGADVELVWFPNYTDSIQALSAGQLDANSQAWSDTMAPLASGIPLKVILVNDNSAGNDAVLAKPGIKSIKDLKGKTVALEQFSISHFLFVTALNKNGMKPGDVNIVNFSAGDAAAAFLAGRVDACVVWNPWVNKIISSGKGKALFTSKDIPGLVPDLLVAHEKALKDATKRKDFAGMVQAWFDVEKFMRENPDAAVKIMAKKVGLAPDEYKAFLPGTKFFDAKANTEAFGPASAPLSLLGVAPTIEKFLRDNKLLEGNLNVTRGLDATFVRTAVAKK